MGGHYKGVGEECLASLQRWMALCGQLAVRGTPEQYQGLIKSWGSWGRRYHTRSHLEFCLGDWDKIRSEAKRPAEGEWALWFHDAIYRTWRRDNEARSAAWAAEVLRQGGASRECIDRVHALVMATAHGEAAPVGDAKLVVDVDLAILGAPPVTYDWFERAVRQEYWWVPKKRYAKSRIGILEGFLARPRIFHSPTMVARLETRARDNLTRAVKALRQPG